MNEQRRRKMFMAALGLMWLGCLILVLTLFGPVSWPGVLGAVALGVGALLAGWSIRDEIRATRAEERRHHGHHDRG